MLWYAGRVVQRAKGKCGAQEVLVVPVVIAAAGFRVNDCSAPKGRSRRRRWLLIGCGAAPAVVAACLAYSLLETRWLRTVPIDLSQSSASLHIVHISDLHYKGDRRYLAEVVRRINGLRPDFVCFTGDVAERRGYLEEALEVMGQIRAPVFGVPGNHDHWRGDLGQTDRLFRKAGGRLLVNTWTSWEKAGARVILVGIDDMTAGRPMPEWAFPPLGACEGAKVVVLCHSPAIFDRMGDRRFDLGLAGHSHGGQVRLPLLGALTVPRNTGCYSMGLYRTSRGVIYVNPGIGTWWLPLRFLCRPEVTLIRL